MNKIILILLIGLLNIGPIYSQCCPYISDISITPVNPSPSDSIYLITNVTTPNDGSYFGYEIVNGLNNEITVTACYWKGNFTVLTDFTDTINLGVKNIGNYSLIFNALSSTSYTSCVPDDTTSMDLTFEVGGINSIENVSGELNVRCFPNPILDNNMRIYSSIRIKKVVIMDTYGKVIFNNDKLNTIFYEVDINELSFVQI